MHGVRCRYTNRLGLEVPTASPNHTPFVKSFATFIPTAAGLNLNFITARCLTAPWWEMADDKNSKKC